MEEEISLVELFEIIKKHFRLIVITTLGATVIAAIYTLFLVTPIYEATTEILVTQTTEENASVSQQDITTSISLINTYEDIIRNDVILDPVIEELNLDVTTDQLRDSIAVQVNESSQVFSVQAQSENPYEAAEIANATAGIFQEEIYEMMDVDNVTIISAATPVMDPASPNNLLNIIIGVLLGGMLGVGLVFIRELTDNTVKTEEYVHQTTGWSSLGHINTFTKQDLTVKTPLPKMSKQPETNEQEMKRTRRRV